MNKQNERLISADKLFKWLENDDDADGFWAEGEGMKASVSAFGNLKKIISQGKLDPDPIPLPTLKPGDKVKRKKLLSEYDVIKVRNVALVRNESGYESLVSVDDLEPIKEDKANVR